MANPGSYQQRPEAAPQPRFIPDRPMDGSGPCRSRCHNAPNSSPAVAAFSARRGLHGLLQMLLRTGPSWAQILRPETVGAMRTNRRRPRRESLKSSAPAWSNDANLFPGMQQKWGLSFDINTRRAQRRSAAATPGRGFSTATTGWIPSRRSRAPCSLSCFRFYDARVVDLYGALSGLVHGLARV